MSIRLAAYISPAPTGWISVKDIGSFYENLESPNLIKIGQNFGHFTWRPMHILLLLAT
jgi:hypothetical protein